MSYQKIAKVSLTCGSCRYLQTDRLDKEPCNAKGKIVSSKSCTQHSPDVFPLVRSAGHVYSDLVKLSEVVSSMGHKQLEVIAAMMLRARVLKRFGFTFFQKVYVRAQGDHKGDYISNFGVAHIIDADKEFIRIVGDSGTSYTLMNEKESTSFYTVNRFQALRKEMLEGKKFVDPDADKYTKGSIVGNINNIDNLDNVGAVDYDKKGKRKIVKASKVNKDDLVSFVTRLQAGHLKMTKSRQRAEESVSF